MAQVEEMRDAHNSITTLSWPNGPDGPVGPTSNINVGDRARPEENLRWREKAWSWSVVSQLEEKKIDAMQ